jgi:glyoxylase I family protein
MIAKGANHFSLHVRDLEASRAFYGDLLGLPEADRPNLGFPGEWYQAGAVQLHLIQVPAGFKGDLGSPPPTLNPLANHIAFEIDDYEVVKAKLEESGQKVIGLGVESGQLFMQDPDGHVVEFIRPGGLVGGRAGR